MSDSAFNNLNACLPGGRGAFKDLNTDSYDARDRSLSGYVTGTPVTSKGAP